MVSLGRFGTVKADEVVSETTFDYFDTTIALSPLAFNELEYVDLMEQVGSLDENDPRSLTLIKDLLRMLLARDEGPYAGQGFETFWALAKQNRQGVEDLMAVYTALMEAQTARPTQKPSDSSAGQPPTAASSQVVSSSAEAAPGRPDLQVMRDSAAEDRRRVALAAVAG